MGSGGQNYLRRIFSWKAELDKNIELSVQRQLDCMECMDDYPKKGRVVQTQFHQKKDFWESG